MESFYQIAGRAGEISERIDALNAQLDAMYEENEGEITEDTEAMEEAKDELEDLKKECLATIVDNSDAYAEIALDKMSQKKVLEAELKAVKEEQKKVIDRIQARINRVDRSIDFWKQNFDEAMRLADMTRIGGVKTDKKHSVYYTTTTSVEADEERLIEPFEDIINTYRASVPNYLILDVRINKTELKRQEKMPEGAALINKRNINIK